MQELENLTAMVQLADERSVREARTSADWEERGLLGRLVRTDRPPMWERVRRRLRL
jgi:hypothetical protein